MLFHYTDPFIPVVVPPTHHVLIVGRGGDLEPLDDFIGAKKQGVVPRCVVRRSDKETAYLTNYRTRGSKGKTKC